MTINRINLGQVSAWDAKFLQGLDTDHNGKIDQGEIDSAVEKAGGDSDFDHDIELANLDYHVAGVLQGATIHGSEPVEISFQAPAAKPAALAPDQPAEKPWWLRAGESHPQPEKHWWEWKVDTTQPQTKSTPEPFKVAQDVIDTLKKADFRREPNKALDLASKTLDKIKTLGAAYDLSQKADSAIARLHRNPEDRAAARDFVNAMSGLLQKVPGLSSFQQKAIAGSVAALQNQFEANLERVDKAIRDVEKEGAPNRPY